MHYSNQIVEVMQKKASKSQTNFETFVIEMQNLVWKKKVIRS